MFFFPYERKKNESSLKMFKWMSMYPVNDVRTFAAFYIHNSKQLNGIELHLISKSEMVKI